MRIKWSQRQVVLAALVSFIVGAAGLLVLFRQGTLEEQSVPLQMEKSFDGSSLESVSIATDTANTTFVRSESGQLTVRLTGTINQRDLPYAAIEADPGSNGTTTVEVNIRTFKHFQVGMDAGRLFYDIRHGFRNNAKVVVELPDKAYKELRAKSDTGKLTLPEVQADMLVLSSDTGDVTVAGFSGKRLKANTDTGTIRLKQVKGGLELSSDTGDFHLEVDSLPGGASLRTDTGDINLTLNGSIPVQFDFQSDMGKTTAEAANAAFNFDWKEKHKLRGKLGSGGPLIKASSDTGNITLEVK